ncbi:MAG: DUF7343 domain-containing protein [Methanothrix sp.]
MIEKGCKGSIGTMRRQAIISLVLLSAILLQPVLAATDQPPGQSLILNVYLDSSGKALVTGYAESPVGLSFLNGSQFRLENDSHQLYALTAGLTTKSGDLWTLRFDAEGRFDDYRVTFYMPNQTSLGEINISQGLGYLLSASNESLVADVQGWDISNPRISIEYQQPLAADANSQLPPPPGALGEGAALVMLVIAAALMIAGFGFAVFLQRKRQGSEAVQVQTKRAVAGPGMRSETEQRSEAARGEALDSALPLSPSASGTERPLPAETSFHANFPSKESDALSPEDDSHEGPAILQERHETDAQMPARMPAQMPSQSSIAAKSETDECEVEPEAASAPGPSQEEGASAPAPAGTSEEKPRNDTIAVSSEMEAVMQTLTARERAVMSTLISHKGRMTQAEIRYETGTPKSSLTGILISLERRKLVIKKEWGRTNIIELSEWFLSKRERS